MRITLAIALFPMIFLSACNDKDNADTKLSKVDIHGTIVVTKPARIDGGFHIPAQRTRMILLEDGSQIPLHEFLQRNCQETVSSDICIRGRKIAGIDRSSGPVDVLPAGL